MKYIALIALVLLAGCEKKEPLEVSRSENGWHVHTCFRYVVNDKQYSIHRFSDGTSEWRYFIVPEGEVIDVEEREDSEGNTYTVPVNNIPTVKGK